jgi:tetratricopeptide (TPR) repeat protein
MVDANSEAAARAWVAFKSGRLDEATAICVEMLERSPDHAGLIGVFGVIIGERGDIDAAVQIFQRARSIAPDNPDWPFNLGIAYIRSGRPYEARVAILEALRLRPQSIEYSIELAVLHASLDEDQDALATCLDVIARAPTNADAHLLLAETLLKRGEMVLGWGAWLKGLQLRRERPAGKTSPGASSMTGPPRWNGERSPEVSVVLDCDRSFGEIIQFVRYIPALARECRTVTLRSPIGLVPVLSRIPEVTIVPIEQRMDLCGTAHAMLSELPALLASTLENIPGGMSYLDADPVRVRVWHERLSAWNSRGEMLVGLIWCEPITNQTRARYSLAFSQLAPLLAVPGVAFIGLQKPAAPGDVDAMQRANILNLSAALTDFGETAAVVANLDLVISIDGAIAHLAGALGRKIWLLLSRPADWRWFRDRDDSPWYPSMRLFRQRNIGEWEEPLTRAAAALAAFVVAGNSTRTVSLASPIITLPLRDHG